MMPGAPPDAAPIEVRAPYDGQLLATGARGGQGSCQGHARHHLPAVPRPRHLASRRATAADPARGGPCMAERAEELAREGSKPAFPPQMEA